MIFLALTDVMKQEKAAVLELSPAQRIEQLESRKQKLLQQRSELQIKIDRVTAKVENTASTTEPQ